MRGGRGIKGEQKLEKKMLKIGDNEAEGSDYFPINPFSFTTQSSMLTEFQSNVIAC